jgi:hypothetical protein
VQQIRLILEAEACACRSLEAAREESSVLGRHAEDESHRCVCEARAAHDAIADAAEEQVVQKAREHAAQLAAVLQGRLTALRAKAERRIEIAVKAALESLLPRRGDNAR